MSSDSRKREKKMLVPLGKKKSTTTTKQSGCFSLNLKANSTECFVQQNHKRADKQVSKCEKQKMRVTQKNTRRHRPNCLCQCQPECTCIVVGGGCLMEGLPPPFTKLCQIQNKRRARGGKNWPCYCTFFSFPSNIPGFEKQTKKKTFLRGKVPCSFTQSLFNFLISVLMMWLNSRSSVEPLYLFSFLLLHLLFFWHWWVW